MAIRTNITGIASVEHSRINQTFGYTDKHEKGDILCQLNIQMQLVT